MSSALRISLEEIDKKLVLRIEGRIDASSAVQLERKLLQLVEEQYLYLLLDFTQVEYLSSAGMRVLLSIAKKLKSKQGHLALFSLQDDVSEIIRLSGFDKILPICLNEKQALRFAP